MKLHTHRLPGLVVTGHEFRAPLDYAQPDGAQITLFARELVAPGKEHDDLPWLVYFQGGPGFAAPRPVEASGWIKRALQEYRLLLLDQRGTGRSTPITAQTLARFAIPQTQADYLKHFRADNIVRDAELIRQNLLKDRSWSVLGQSYGGFCVCTYLSLAPHGLRQAIITGGLPSLDRPIDDVYRATYRRVLEQNRRYYARYPQDAALTQEIVDYLQKHEVQLPAGGRLTPWRFQQLGLAFGASGGFEQIHYLLEEAFIDNGSGRHLSFPFLRHFEQMHSFETNPIFAILHEAIYCQGAASRWSAQRLRSEYPQFEADPNRPPLFTGEMIYPWMFDEYPQLCSLKAAAEILAAYEGWPPLYDTTALRQNTTPCVAAIYYDDMYVERTYSEETAAAIANMKVWVTNQYQHNGLRADGEAVLGWLLDMLHGEV
jgi:pimeloyl-ACP methyl ester carboxylesterase